VPIFIGQLLVCEKHAPVLTKLIDAGLVVIEPGTFESPDFDAPRISIALVTLTLARRTCPGLHVGIVGLQLHHAPLMTVRSM
jgi:hypothetical protein